MPKSTSEKSNAPGRQASLHPKLSSRNGEEGFNEDSMDAHETGVLGKSHTELPFGRNNVLEVAKPLDVLLMERENRDGMPSRLPDRAIGAREHFLY